MKIAVLICSLVFDSQKAFMKGIERRIRDWGDICSVFCCHVNIYGSSNYEKGEYSIFNLPDLSKFDGIVFVRNTFQDSFINNSLAKRILESKVPCVCIDGFSPDFVNITSDEPAIMETLTSHLIEAHDCRKIYFLGGLTDSLDTEYRFQGYLSALKKAGLPFRGEWRYDGTFECSSGANAAEYFLNLESEYPDAIVCCNDEMAVGLISELKKRGVKVPNEIKVGSIDFDSISRIYTPKLTTVKRQQYHKGVNAINVLHSYSEHSVGETITLPIALSCGNTCGCSVTDEAKNDFSTTNTLATDRYFQAELTQLTKLMTANLMATKDRDSIIDVLLKHANKVKPTEMYLCLNPEPDYLIDYSDYSKALSIIDRDNQEDYAPLLLSAFTIKNGKAVIESEEQMFEKDSLLPPSAEGGTKGATYYFLPIHYLNRNFGYAILGTSGELVRNDFFPSWCTTASNAFENTRKRTVMEQMITALDRMWIYDTLTGIYNRAGFFKLSEGLIRDAINYSVPVCVIFLDVDGLKNVNDNFGHDEGDNLIKGVADALKKVKRHGEIIMRYGGDEFVLMAAGYTEADADECISKIEQAMHEASSVQDKPYDLEASIGYYITTLSKPE